MTPTFRHILVPTDFSETSAAALDYAKALATRFGASLHLLHVFEDPYGPAAFAPEVYASVPVADSTLRADIEHKLGELLTPEDRARFEVTVAVVEGLAAPAISEYAAENAIDVIVMGTHGRTGFSHLLLGSVAERVVRSAPCAVLTIRERRVPHHRAVVASEATSPALG